MTLRRLVATLVATATLGLPAVPSASAQQLEIATVVSGLNAPVFVGHAGDGTNRLFILERAGRILVLPSGASMGIVFLDITAKVLTTGSEQGLLGLAFHPQYSTNGRFFVFYTRRPDGAIQVSEFRVTTDPNLAGTQEFPLLTIDHSAAANHNGGMLAFGPDGYLYIAVGDGGGANDVPNNAQNLNVLLGKILRIDINTPSGYLIPPSNPFAGSIPGLNEIYAYGMRNPWRLSFDRQTGQMWVGDVGQNGWEEVDSPIVSGGNYGWRVFEGTHCTGNGPAPCDPANYKAPVIEYAHASGRCSITGGYVYRGSQGTFPTGTYVYADYCTGEIFTSNSGGQNVLDTASISSFGEDQAGEIYVALYGGGNPGAGSVGRLRLPPGPCTYWINPTSRSIAANGGTGTVAVTTGPDCTWTGVANAAWLHVTSGASGTGNGNVGYSVDVNTSQSARTGTMTVAGQTFTVNQSASGPCAFSITPTRVTFGAGPATASVSVTAGAGCNWTATSNASWITVTGGTPGSANGVVTYAVAQYPGKPKRRSGTLTVAGQTLTVTQSK